MAIQDNLGQWSTLLLGAIATPFAIAAIILRFIATRKSGRSIGSEDWFALAGTLFYILYNSIAIWNVSILQGRTYTQIPLDQLTYMLKVIYITGQCFVYNQLFTKLSIVLLYYRIFSVNRTYAFWILVLGASQIAWAIAASAAQFFQCSPIYKFWNSLQEGTCFNDAALLIGFEIPNCLIDFGMVALVLVMLRDLHIRRSTKWKLGVLFAVGGFVGVIGFIKIGSFFTQGQDSLQVLGNWGMAQMFCSIICCCVPIYNHIMPKSLSVLARRVYSSIQSVSFTSWPRTNAGSGSHTQQSGPGGRSYHLESSNGPTMVAMRDNRTSQQVREDNWGWLQLPDSRSGEGKGFGYEQQEVDVPSVPPLAQDGGRYDERTVYRRFDAV
ncbi:hypothetical protein QBC35DRAFT_114599 [Podospora australis]|uniref:Rhodopsin domain-containing protein n=1 Tax=Podospora australis TaxID=1536484 RepID=A0AAN6WK45_9PEZI|nr:hypothetical protein QBC35DRAFT_114599 [Podospora australis]